MSRPTLIVGDIQGDFERLAEALEPFPSDSVDTIFLGDFFQGGRLGAAGGIEAARLARARPHSRFILGNHDLFIIAVLEVRRGGLTDTVLHSGYGGIEEFWRARRGDPADLDGLANDPELEGWLRSLPLMLRLDDGTIVQHTDDDAYAQIGANVDVVNARALEWMASATGLMEVHRHLVGRHGFDDPTRLDDYLSHFGGIRLVHGHTPHWNDLPDVRHDGRLLGFDGRFSRYWGRTATETSGPIAATVGLLPAVDG